MGAVVEHSTAVVLQLEAAGHGGSFPEQGKGKHTLDHSYFC